jgi:hypothetical protein
MPRGTVVRAQKQIRNCGLPPEKHRARTISVAGPTVVEPCPGSPYDESWLTAEATLTVEAGLTTL